MDMPTLWIIIAGMTLVTFIPRLSVIGLMNREMPPTVARALRYVPPAALSAIIFPALFMQDDALALSPGNERLLAGIVAALVAWRSKNTLLTIAVGMVLLWILQAV
ncbi:MAG TPA: AzlD domain-containing protein [Aggregatilinea sp.]|jgi:branched-subunit amino acid transport protein|uniref:AzlD domain-containing protein n=1 Tax=Aggregatilinea sp. TaxID=2806333 RepID=UPI002B63191A|nr:AzlD domain-containing protein [Aggregatilinea sp.]HML20696.1 AzlD domain-containing protein [Aggregatilinea sp.]